MLLKESRFLVCCDSLRLPISAPPTRFFCAAPGFSSRHRFFLAPTVEQAAPFTKVSRPTTKTAFVPPFSVRPWTWCFSRLSFQNLLPPPPPRRPPSCAFAAMFEEKKKPRHAQTHLLPAADPAAPDSDDNVAPLLVCPTSCNLLNSHLSIYEALTNPELDICIALPPLAARESFATPPPPRNFPLVVPVQFDDATASFLSWQSVNFPPESSHDSLRLWRQMSPCSPSLKLTTSILSSTDDSPLDAASRPLSEPMVVVPSAEKAIMVFETDEEDDDDDDDDETGVATNIIASSPQFGDDDKTLTNGLLRTKHVSVPHNQQTSFIMPRMSLSDSATAYRLTVLSSSNKSLRSEVTELIEYIRQNINPAIVRNLHISHLVLEQPPFDFDLAAVRSSDLLFLVNDGSWVFSQFLASLVGTAKDQYPKLTVLNIMTSNYFVNLLEIINYLTPHQVWKALSLSSDAILLKVKTYLDSELGSHDRYRREYESQKQRFKRDKLKPSKRNSKAMSSGLVPTKKTNYRRMERQLCEELLMSLSLHDVDPLNLSSSLGHMKTLFDGLVKFFSTSGLPQLPSEANLLRDDYFYLFCSFSVGISVGFVVASGAAAVFGTGAFTRLLLRSPDDAQQLVAVAQKPASAAYFADTLNGLDRGVDYLASCVRVCVNQVVGRSKPVVQESALVIDTVVNDLALFGTFLVQCAWGGLAKATGLLFG